MSVRYSLRAAAVVGSGAVETLMSVSNQQRHGGKRRSRSPYGDGETLRTVPST
jgi:hypothetical protein